MQDILPEVILHVLGTMSEQLTNTTYFLEQMSSRADTLDDSTYCLLLSTAGWLFLCKPAQTQLILSNILSKGFSANRPAVKAKAAHMYALLEEKPNDMVKLLKPCFLPSQSEITINLLNESLSNTT